MQSWMMGLGLLSLRKQLINALDCDKVPAETTRLSSTGKELFDDL
jgi:hypothetical protein